jgi:hypothetical protein
MAGVELRLGCIRMARKILKHAAIALASAALGFIIGFIAAFLTSPFWNWFESATGIESYGHSGPDDWVFQFT